VFLEKSVPPLIEINTAAKKATIPPPQEAPAEVTLHFLTDADIGNIYLSRIGDIGKVISHEGVFFRVRMGGVDSYYTREGFYAGREHDVLYPKHLVQQNSHWKVGKMYFDDGPRSILITEVNHNVIVGKTRNGMVRRYSLLGSSLQNKPNLQMLDINMAEMENLWQHMQIGGSLRIKKYRFAPGLPATAGAVIPPSPRVVFLMYYEAYILEKA
jgi:hypothetical protein